MDKTIKTYFDQLEEKDRNTQYEAYQQLIIEMNNKVEWAYDVWLSEEVQKNMEIKNIHDPFSCRGCFSMRPLEYFPIKCRLML
ncbi:hypothetical protein ACTWP4_08210 [Gracilibacillus sp. D59]|uniref:hypothetical protein n=1 Tax=Gracilibacillus sp. D59 TaxID=3457434 RepID=UPI003FCC744C